MKRDMAIGEEISPNFSAKVISQQSSQALTFELQETSKKESLGRRNIDLMEVQESEYLSKSPLRLNKIQTSVVQGQNIHNQLPQATAQSYRKRNNSELASLESDPNSTHLNKTRIVNANDTTSSPTLEMSKIKIMQYHQANSELILQEVVPQKQANNEQKGSPSPTLRDENYPGLGTNDQSKS